MAFAGRHPMLSLALVGLTVAIIYTEIARLFRGYKPLKPAELPLLANQPGTVTYKCNLHPQMAVARIIIED